jgi:hypothetical protein
MVVSESLCLLNRLARGRNPVVVCKAITFNVLTTDVTASVLLTFVSSHATA